MIELTVSDSHRPQHVDILSSRLIANIYSAYSHTAQLMDDLINNYNY